MHFRDYLGVWPDIGSPPDIPFPDVCGRTFCILALTHTRYLEYNDVYGWCIAAEVDTPTHSEENHPHVRWAKRVSPTATRRQKVLAARVFNGERPQELDLLIAAKGEGDWLGQVGERYTGRIVVTDVTPLPSHPEFGDQYEVTGTIDGCRFRWVTGESCWCDAGDECDVRYTVKRHVTVGGVKTTDVSRVQKCKTT